MSAVRRVCLDLRRSQAVATRRLTRRIANGMNRIRILAVARYHIAANLEADSVISRLTVRRRHLKDRASGAIVIGKF